MRSVRMRLLISHLIFVLVLATIMSGGRLDFSLRTLALTFHSGLIDRDENVEIRFEKAGKASMLRSNFC